MAITSNWFDQFKLNIACNPYPSKTSNPKMEMLAGMTGAQIEYWGQLYPSILTIEENPSIGDFSLGFWFGQIECGNIFEDESMYYGILARLYVLVAEQEAGDSTVIAPATTGAQTIQTSRGRVNFAIAATSLVVTNAQVTANSNIQATVASNDSTMKSVQAVAGTGSFTLYANAAPTAITKVDFLINY